MRIKVEFETENEHLPIDYRRKFLSYLKSAIDEYSHDLYKTLYSGGHNPKSFCFSICFTPKVIIASNEITLHSKRLYATFTTRDTLLGIHLVNALMAYVNKWFPLADSNNKLRALSITKVQERSITANTVQFKILSPIVIRDHDEEEEKDWYLTFEDNGFEEIWKRNLKTELQDTLGRDVSGDIKALVIKPVNLRKTVVRSYGIYIPCTIGSLVLEGEKYLLEYLYKTGCGSKRSMGFGCLDVM